MMDLLILSLTVVFAASIPAVYVILGILALVAVIGIVYFYTKLWQNRKKPGDEKITRRE